MSKHTPGPWYADAIGRIWRRDPRNLYEYGGGVAGDRPVATVIKIWYGEEEAGFPLEANARLIAAAPELLEALKDMLSGWRYIQQDPMHREIYGVGWDRAQRLAEAAIAKAEGTTSC